ncbi:MAG: helix-turn-helix domain-containing protein [Candidatus Aminicenantes bacterium]|nr:helix-turn-helix domain-containing protein [Candidatus Aminicenantes bacterium]
MNVDKLLTIKEVAEILGISISTAKIWASKRKIPVVKVGRLLRVAPEALEEYILRNTEWKKGEKRPQTQKRSCRARRAMAFEDFVEGIKDEKNA